MASTRNLVSHAEVEQALRGALEGLEFGSVHVRGLTMRLGSDAEGEPAWFVNVELSDPEGPTWPFDDVLALRHCAWDVLLDLNPETPYYVSLRPEHEDPPIGS